MKQRSRLGGVLGFWGSRFLGWLGGGQGVSLSVDKWHHMTIEVQRRCGAHARFVEASHARGGSVAMGRATWMACTTWPYTQPKPRASQSVAVASARPTARLATASGAVIHTLPSASGSSGVPRNVMWTSASSPEMVAMGY